MLILRIRWQRLVEEDGKTCPRCGSTEKELENAFLKLKEALGVLGFQVEMEKYAITPEDFEKDPLSSNRIWINDKSIEEWLGAEGSPEIRRISGVIKVGKSKCCDVCGDSECRTIEIGKDVYESVPASMIVKAGLIAAANSLSIEKPAGNKYFLSFRKVGK